MRFFAPLLALMLFALPLHAQELTDQAIERWAASYSELTAWAESNAVEPDVEPGQGMFGRAMTALEGSGHYSDVRAILSGHGFADPMDWADMSDRIFAAYTAVAMEGAQADLQAMQPQMQEQMEALLANPNLTDAQKDEIRKQMEQMVGMTAAMQPGAVDPADIAAVERNRAVIDSVFDGPGN